MTINLNSEVNYWLSGAGSELITGVSQLAESNDRAVLMLKAKEKLASNFTTEQISAAVQTVTNRHRLVKEGYKWAANGYFLDTAVAQASNVKIVCSHAKNFQNCNTVVDVCCGLGFDSFALAGEVERVIAIEQDPLVATFALCNLEIQQIRNVELRCQSAEEFFTDPDSRNYAGYWFDPDRRRGGQRTHNINEYSPSFEFIHSLDLSGRLGIKVSPLVDLASVPSIYNFQILGAQKECKEVVLYKNFEIENQVKIVDLDYTWSINESESESESVEVECEEIATGSFLIDPHNALKRSPKLKQFFTELNALKLKSLPLAVSHEFTGCVACEEFQVLQSVPFRKKSILNELKKLNWSKKTTIKKYGLPESAEKLREVISFPKAGVLDPQNIIYVLSINQRKVCVLCKRLT